jgi:hypothetical protein
MWAERVRGQHRGAVRATGHQIVLHALAELLELMGFGVDRNNPFGPGVEGWS